MAENKAREVRRDEIVNASLSCFASKGYSSTSVSEICSAAGITKGGFYWHFKSKKEVLKAVMDYLCTRQEEQWSEMSKLEISKGSITTVGVNFIRASLSSPDVIRLKSMLESESLRDTDIMEALSESQKWVLKQLEDLSLKILETYPVITMDKECMARLFNLVVSGIVRDEILQGEETEPEKTWSQFIDLLIP